MADPPLASSDLNDQNRPGIQQTASLESSEAASPKVELERGLDDDDWENDPSNARNWSLGRKWTVTAILFNICNVLSIAFNLGCAYAPTAGSLIGFRFLGEFFSL
ncbi:hypothetical protein C0991_001145 [Blastosporella zonata]|nr:hypothetical protein C0991_001145 [Blastosporella zonata]